VLRFKGRSDPNDFRFHAQIASYTPEIVLSEPNCFRLSPETVSPVGASFVLELDFRDAARMSA